MPNVRFVKENKVIEVKDGENLREAALRNGIEIYRGIHKQINCRGRGSCATCRVLIVNDTLKSASPMRLLEKIRLGLSYVAIGFDHMRLSCQVSVHGDLDVETQPALNLYGKSA